MIVNGPREIYLTVFISYLCIEIADGTQNILYRLPANSRIELQLEYTIAVLQLLADGYPAIHYFRSGTVRTQIKLIVHTGAVGTRDIHGKSIVIVDRIQFRVRYHDIRYEQNSRTGFGVDRVVRRKTG